MSQYYLVIICADLDNIKMDLREMEESGMDWIRTGISGGLL
jgi:hypothetical protein